MWAAGLLVPSHIFDLGFTKAYRLKFAMNFEATDMAKVKRGASQCLEEKSRVRISAVEQLSTWPCETRLTLERMLRFCYNPGCLFTSTLVMPVSVRV